MNNRGSTQSLIKQASSASLHKQGSIEYLQKLSANAELAALMPKAPQMPDFIDKFSKMQNYVDQSMIEICDQKGSSTLKIPGQPTNTPSEPIQETIEAMGSS